MWTQPVDRRWRALSWLIVLQAVLDLTLTLLALRYDNRVEHTLFNVRAGLLTSQLFLAAAVSVLLTGSIVRQLIVSLGVSSLVMAVPLADDYLDQVGMSSSVRAPLQSNLLNFAIFWLTVTGTSLVVYRWRQVRLRHRDDERVARQHERRQFGIRHLLLLTTITAILALLVRETLHVYEGEILAMSVAGNTVFSLLLALWLLPLLSAVLRPVCPAHVRILAGVSTLAIPAAVLLLVLWANAGSDFLFILSGLGLPLLTTLITSLATLAVLRWMGWRLTAGVESHPVAEATQTIATD